MVGIGTAAILLSFILLILVKSFGRYLLRRYRIMKYTRRAAAKSSALLAESSQPTENPAVPSMAVISSTAGDSHEAKIGCKEFNGDLV